MRSRSKPSSAAQYLERTVSKLDERGIRDRNLWIIQRLVADEIIALTAASPGT